MGICSSCLGRRRAAGQNETLETSRLLYDQSQYGTMNGGLSHGVVQIDPQDTQREEAASQRILAETSEHLIDVLALQTPMTDSTISPGVDSTSNAKQERYQALLQQVLSAELTFKSRQNGINSSGDLPDEYVSTLKTIRRDHVGPLVAGWQGGSMSIDEVTG